MKEQTITLFLADDHQIVIDGLYLLISNEFGFKILGSATDGKKAYKEILLKKPDIALIDLKMPGMNGIELINSLKKQVKTHFIILSMHSDNRYISDAMNYGASGYLLKNTGKAELMNCIYKVMDGEKYFPRKSNNVQDNISIFTPRELEILKLVINEFTTQEIALQLNLSHFTIETHRKNICRKANTKTAIGLIKYISENGIEL